MVSCGEKGDYGWGVQPLYAEAIMVNWPGKGEKGEMKNMARRVNGIEDGLEAIQQGELELDEEKVAQEVQSETNNLARAYMKALLLLLTEGYEGRETIGKANKDGTRMLIDINLADEDLAQGLKTLGLWAQRNGFGDKLSYLGHVVSMLVEGKRDAIKYASVLAGGKSVKQQVIALLNRGVSPDDVKSILGLKAKSAEAKLVTKVSEAWSALQEL